MPSTLTLVPDERQPPDPEKPAGPEMRDAAPFIAWVEQRITTTDRELRREARERGIDPPKETGALEILLRDIGWTAAGPRKRLYGWRRGQPGRGATLDEDSGLFMASAEMIDTALEQAGVAVWEIYPEAGEADPDAQELFCPVCSDEVPVFDGRCAWCETRITRPHTTAPLLPPRKPPGTRTPPTPRRRKSSSLRGLTPSERPDPELLVGEPLQPPGVADRRKGLPEAFIREAMRVHLQAGLCFKDTARILLERYPGRWARAASLADGLVASFRRRGVMLDVDRRSIRKRPELLERERELIEAYLETRERGYAYEGTLPAELVWEAAYRYYLDGWGLNRIAGHLWPMFPWIENTSAKSLGLTLHRVFKTNGWPTRPQREATAAANWRHGMSAHRGNRRYRRYRYRAAQGEQPRCAATATSTGRPCRNYAMRGDRHCYAHCERTREEREAALARGHQTIRSELVDSAPFVAWLQARVKQYGTQLATSRIVALNTDQLSLILRTGGANGTPGKITRRMIERSLNAALENDPNLLVPRFRDLYDATPARVVTIQAPAATPAAQVPLAA